MLNKASTNDDGDHHHHHQQQQQQYVVIGDILLHSELKIAIIQVMTHSLSSMSSLTIDKPIIHRLPANTSGINASPTVVPCDLKNISTDKVTHERIKSSSSSKKLMRMQKAGLALVKELKSKVVNPNHSEPKTITADIDADSERTHF